METQKLLVVIDSNWKFRNKISSLFENRPVEVLGFDTGDFALEFIRETGIHPDLVIVDPELPLGHLSGIEVAHKLRELYGIQSPILFLSEEPTVEIWPKHISNSRAMSKQNSIRRILQEISGRGTGPALIHIQETKMSYT